MLNGSPAVEPYSVSALTALIKGTLEERYAGVWVAGELSDVKLAASGHLYFRLKDEGAVLGCAMFRPRPQRLGFVPADGQEVVARGDVSVYPPRGSYQLICDELVLRGLGELQRAFEELKRRLAAEGLFAAEGKRPLPRLPKRVGVVTSRDGAALRDILRVLARRHAGLDVVLRHAQVQGEGAGAELARAVEELGASGLVDVLIVGRGGGSYEDLFCFNDERLIRAIRACPVPVISAVGHEGDVGGPGGRRAGPNPQRRRRDGHRRARRVAPPRRRREKLHPPRRRGPGEARAAAARKYGQNPLRGAAGRLSEPPPPAGGRPGRAPAARLTFGSGRGEVRLRAASAGPLSNPCGPPPAREGPIRPRPPIEPVRLGRNKRPARAIEHRVRKAHRPRPPGRHRSGLRLSFAQGRVRALH